MHRKYVQAAVQKTNDTTTTATGIASTAAPTSKRHDGHTTDGGALRRARGTTTATNAKHDGPCIYHTPHQESLPATAHLLPLPIPPWWPMIRKTMCGMASSTNLPPSPTLLSFRLLISVFIVLFSSPKSYSQSWKKHQKDNKQIKITKILYGLLLKCYSSRKKLNSFMGWGKQNFCFTYNCKGHKYWLNRVFVATNNTLVRCGGCLEQRDSFLQLVDLPLGLLVEFLPVNLEQPLEFLIRQIALVKELCWVKHLR